MSQEYSSAQEYPNLNYYLPEISYDATIKSPEEFFGYQLGKWHLNYQQIVNYCQYLSENSTRVDFDKYGQTYEQRPLINLHISNPEHLKDKKSIQSNHQILSNPDLSDNINLDSLPAIIYAGYTVHGNEPSGAQASLLFAYYLAAGQSEEIDQILQNCYVLLDPCMNPDGYNRFASWVNTHKHNRLNPDPNNREFREPWPRGRTNHYWSDLNRDWLLLTHKESRHRVAVFQSWHPNVLTDHHEMGKNNSFFFQPGVPSRTNPNTPIKNQVITEEIAEYHKASLDSIGSSYFTKEIFDDFYYGKGSTYPDAQGSIGILFEQATSRGHLQETLHGKISFPFTIRNQITTSISTLTATSRKRTQLLKYKREFFKLKAKEAEQLDFEGYLIDLPDATRKSTFTSLLNQHNIELFESTKDTLVGEHIFSNNNSIYIPIQQSQYTLIRTIFDEVNKFQDSIFYDVSAWTFPHAFNANWTTLKSFPNDLDPINLQSTLHHQIDIDGKNIMIDWSQYNAPAFLYALLENDIKVYKLGKDLKTKLNEFKKGDLYVSEQESNPVIKELANQFNINITILKKRDASKIEKTLTTLFTMPKVGMLTGQGINAYEAGDHWFQLDKRWNIPISLLDIQFIHTMKLNSYDILICPSGGYKNLDKLKIESYLNDGGTIISFGSSNAHFINNGFLDLEEIENSILTKKEGVTKSAKGAQEVGGAIFNIKLDVNEELFNGYSSNTLAVLKKSNQFYKATTDSFKTVAKYPENSLLSGYCSKENLKNLTNSVAIGVQHFGKGKIIMVKDNPNFRGYWYGGSTLFSNLIFSHN